LPEANLVAVGEIAVRGLREPVTILSLSVDEEMIRRPSASQELVFNRLKPVHFEGS